MEVMKRTKNLLGVNTNIVMQCILTLEKQQEERSVIPLASLEERSKSRYIFTTGLQ